MNIDKKVIKDAVFEFKLFWSIFKTSGCFFQATYLISSIVAVIIYIVSPDLIPGPLDDILLAPWLIPLILSKVWVSFLPDWFVDESRRMLQIKLF